ncbi:MAG: hypothetical protein LBL33_01785 [Tannerella sp.]|nr:hypothetical protein [Tannerella sp.]
MRIATTKAIRQPDEDCAVQQQHDFTVGRAVDLANGDFLRPVPRVEDYQAVNAHHGNHDDDQPE